MPRTSVAIALILAAFSSLADETHTKEINLATTLVDQSRIDEAITILKKVVAEDPGDATAAYELGVAYAAKGDNEKCRSTLEPLAETKTNRPLVLGMLGNCFDQLGDSEKAIEMYRRGLKEAPDNSGLLFNLAITLIQHGKTDEGRELLKHDAEKNPAHASAHLALAQVFENQGFYVPATMSYLHFLAVEPATGRSLTAATRLSKLLDRGFAETKEGANITIDPNERKEEGDYGPMQMMISIAHAASAIDKKKQTKMEKAQGQLRDFIVMFVESAGEGHDDFTSRVQTPFFASMSKAGMVDVFAGMALSLLELPGTLEWSAAHEKQIHAYFGWIQPQLVRPAVVLPKK
jgi:tetratricopeptide (TPR) repeat protein